MEKYTLIIRTGDAEIKAVENTSKEILDHIFPLIEITRGRKRTIAKNTPEEEISYPIEPRLDKLKKVFSGRAVGIALTCESLLKSSEIEFFYNSNNGYQSWVEFLVSLKNEGCFEEIVPVLAINPEDDYYEYNLVKQLQELKKHFKKIIYRSNIIDEFGYDDLDIIKEEVKGISLSILIDCGYTPQASHQNVAEKTIVRISNFRKLMEENADIIYYIVVSTSFPNNVSEMGGEDYDEYLISSVSLHEHVQTKLPNIAYGDYGSINPIRNDGVPMGRGWIPRIDVPLKNLVYYYRQRRPKGVTAYADTYKVVAQSVISDSKFPSILTANWGIQQIINCSSGYKPGATPSFWISVRMNIHIEQQVRRLFY